jgi:CCR4-NOT transcriptional regulation complex NOT5 subunit
MSAIKGAVHWAGEHPVTTGVGVFAIGAILLLMLRPSSGGANNGMASFYAAQAAQAQSGNSLMAVQEQGKAATAIAQISANRDVHIADTAAATNAQINTVQAQTDVSLAGINAGVANAAEMTRQQAQRQQFFLGVGEQQLQGQATPFFLNNMASGNPASAAAALAAWQALIQGGTHYSPAH